MNKKDLVNAVADMYERNKTEVKEVVEGVLDTIKESLEAGEKVELFGFGNFKVIERSARKGRNPATGKSINIPASKGVKFKPSKTLKDLVN